MRLVNFSSFTVVCSIILTNTCFREINSNMKCAHITKKAGQKTYLPLKKILLLKRYYQCQQWNSKKMPGKWCWKKNYFSFQISKRLHFHSHDSILSTIYQLFTKKHHNWFSEDSTFVSKASTIFIFKWYWRISSKIKQNKNWKYINFLKMQHFFFPFQTTVLYF